jgi:hypothetical protein
MSGGAVACPRAQSAATQDREEQDMRRLVLVFAALLISFAGAIA